jgi:hypothetical protein
MKQDKLQVMVCLSADGMPADDNFTVVKVTDGDRTQFIKFGRHTNLRTIWSRIPILFMDRAYDKRRRKQKAV